MMDVLISYRRGDDPHAVDRLFETLRRALHPYRIFLDVENIPVGTDFEEHLKRQVSSCSVLLAVMGSRWLDIRGDDGERRLDNPRDFVRIEIETALDRGIPVVPVLLDNTAMPTADQLPGELKALTKRQNWEVTRKSFAADAAGLAQRIIQILAGAAAVQPSAEPAAPVADALALPDKPSIAVLPFQNMSGDREQEYFADGMVEEITTALSRVRQFFVIARNSSFTYKGRSIDVKQVGRELGVRYVVEGSVRKAADRVRVNAQLVDAITGHHVWAEHYDRELAAIFVVQDDIADKVVASIEPQLYSAEGARARRKPPESLDAWECVVRALTHINARSVEDFARSRQLLERAIGLDPSYAQAYALIAYLTGMEVHYCWKPRDALEPALAAAMRAIALDNDDAWAHFALASLYNLLQKAERAITECERALALNPNFALAYGMFATALSYLGRGQEALLKVDEANRLSPRELLRGVNSINRAIAYFSMGQYRDAADCARNAVQESPHLVPAWRSLVVNCALAGEIAEAREALKTLKRLSPDLSLKWIEEWLPYAGAELRRRYFEAFGKAGLE
jgi:TolB-like protein/tetratricopeptide (TPR) repeat protein